MTNLYSSPRQAIKDSPDFEKVRDTLVLRSKVLVVPRPGTELRLLGLPRRHRDVLILLLVKDLIPDEFSVEIQLYKEHLLDSRKWSVKERTHLRFPEYHFRDLHPREVFGNLVPTALKLLSNLRFAYWEPRKPSYQSRVRGYKDQGSKRPDDSPSLRRVRFDKSDDAVQQELYAQDQIVKLLGPGELDFIESRGHDLDYLPALSLAEAEKTIEKVDDLLDSSGTTDGGSCQLRQQPKEVQKSVVSLIGRENPYCSDCVHRSTYCFDNLERDFRPSRKLSSSVFLDWD